jgi:hypothetical protein
VRPPIDRDSGKSLLLLAHRDHHESMEVVGHDHEITEINPRAKMRCLAPLPLNDLSYSVEVHLPTFHLTEKALHFVGAEGDKVLADL